MHKLMKTNKHTAESRFPEESHGKHPPPMRKMSLKVALIAFLP